MKATSSARRSEFPSLVAQTITTKQCPTLLSAAKKYAAMQHDLKQQRKALLENPIEGHTNPNGQAPLPDVNDQASAETEQNFLMRIREREQRLVKKINEALVRIDQNTYGSCERCEEEISYARLKARAVTTLCIACKTLEEQTKTMR